MAGSIKIRTKLKGDTCEVKTLIKHPMETGTRKNKKTGKLIPAHFIQEVNCENNGKNVLNALWGPPVSKNPYMSFRFKGAKAGDTVKISWVDNQGKKDSAESKVR